MQLGSFYPFSRNHNSIGQSPQEPYVWGNATAAIIRHALLTRYTILPYLYTQFYMAHMKGSPVARPLFFEFSNGDLSILSSLDTQFLLGRAIMISPVLKEGANTVNAYFPNDAWYDFYSGKSVAGNQYQLLDAPIEKINVHIRGSSIIPTQDPAMTTTASRKNNFGLMVALGLDGHASGQLFLDDGESLDTIETNSFTLIDFSASYSSSGNQGKLRGTAVQTNYITALPPLNKISIFGVTQKGPNQVWVNGHTFSNFTYDSTNQVLTLNSLKLNVLQSLEIQWNM